jgi:glucosamine--fructose-6-phosphate aminotransferase (isomerizing)
MCGIFAYIGPNRAVDIVLGGLKKLTYRGYDSAGIAGVKNNSLHLRKEVGKLCALESLIHDSHFDLDIAIGHTRWATHGIPNKINAHPHHDAACSLAVVHNGIIENHAQLRLSLEKQGVSFLSDTDTEVIAHLIASLYHGDLLNAIQQTVPLLEGTFALAIVHRNHPDEIIAVSNQWPLVIGTNATEAFISSDAYAFSQHTRNAIFLSNTEIARVTAHNVEVFNSAMEIIPKTQEQLTNTSEDTDKGDFEHFTLKEIHQQPQTIRSALASRFLPEYGTVLFEELNIDANELMAAKRILILGCGTSLHAGHIAAYMLEDLAHIPTQVEIASEFRYKNPIVPPGTLVIAISQSGETADTIAAVREVKAKGAKVIALCNVPGSTLVRESDTTLLLHAGPEIGVCSTKAFTSQVAVLSLLTILMARMRHMNKQEGQNFLTALQHLPQQIQQILNHSAAIEAIAKKYAHYQNFFFIGRRYMFPASLEGALKLKEISYINANGYAAGEMKHGPIALLDEQCPVIALCANKMTLKKLLSNLTEVKARHAPLIAIAEENTEGLQQITHEILWIPHTLDELSTILTTVVTQLLAYYIAKERGADIDHPRNLAKSVTVE